MKTKVQVLKRLIRKQAADGIKAAVAGYTVERMVAGIAIQANLKALAVECARKEKSAK